MPAKKVLIIEDEKMLAEMYRDKFVQAGLRAEFVLCAEDGLKVLAKRNKPSLILLDVRLPRESGIQLLKKIKKIPALAKIPVLVFSAFDDPKVREEAAAAGADAYLVKTAYGPNEIVEKIKQYLSK